MRFKIIAIHILLIAVASACLGEKEDSLPVFQPAGPAAEELAPYMASLQILTHKLSLAAAAGNRELTEFYLYESVTLYKEIQEDVPEYRSLPIAQLVESLALPAYEPLLEQMVAEGARANKTRAIDVGPVIGSCNQCHEATKHAFIKITDNSASNPFNQDFRP